MTKKELINAVCDRAEINRIEFEHGFNNLIEVVKETIANDEPIYVPDFENYNQYKWFPWFRKPQGSAGFVCAHTSDAASGTDPIGSRLCFKTESRAEQFGTQFIDLWNKFLLF